MAYGVTPSPKFQAWDSEGNPLSGGLLYTYAAGTTTPVATYSDDAGTVNSNPVVLDPAGRATVFLTVGDSYKFVLKDANDVLQYTQDNVTGPGSDSGPFVESVTGLNTNNADPLNPIVRISVDGSTITGLGTPGSPLIAAGGSGKSFVYVDLGSGTSFTVNWNAASWFKLTPTANFTIAFSNTPGLLKADNIVLEIVAASGYALTLPAGGTWGALGEPEFSPTTDLVTVGMRNNSSTSFWMLAFPGAL